MQRDRMIVLLRQKLRLGRHDLIVSATASARRASNVAFAQKIAKFYRPAENQANQFASVWLMP
jgi:hypothetical protein